MRRMLLACLFGFLPAMAFAQNAVTPPALASVDEMPPPAGPFHPDLLPEQHIMMAFYAANISHDGHLTLAQAKVAKFKLVVDHFNEIDVAKRGYVTFYDIQAWHLDQMAKHLEKQAETLRAMDK